MEERFFAAVDVVKSIPDDGTFEPSDEMMLKLYAFEKQATEGPCCEPKPYVWNISSRAKWMAWSSLGTMSKEEAMSSYVEELSKVVETMSYNDKIARFISLMGPFYEFVSSDDKKDKCSSLDPLSVLENYSPPTLSELYRMSRNDEPESDKSVPIQQLKSNELDLSRYFEDNTPESSLSSPSSDISDFDLLSDLSDVDSSEDEKAPQVVDMSADESQSSLSQQNILHLAFINLQTSMEEVLKKFNNLHSLAESADLCHLEAPSENERWCLDSTATAFAFLWPVACTAMLEDF